MKVDITESIDNDGVIPDTLSTKIVLSASESRKLRSDLADLDPARMSNISKELLHKLKVV